MLQGLFKSVWSPRLSGERWDRLYLWCWGGLSTLLVAMAPSQVFDAMPFWLIPPLGLGQALLCTAAFLALLAWLQGQSASSRGLTIPGAIVAAAVCYGAAYLVRGSVRPELANYSRAQFGLSMVLGVGLALMPHIFATRLRLLRVTALAAAVAGIIALGFRPTLTGAPATEILTTALKPITKARYMTLLPPVATGRAGAIEPFGSGFVVVTGDGDFFAIESTGADLTARRLPLSLPADPPPSGGGPFIERGGDHRVLDFKIDSSRTPARVFVSSQERNVAKDCYTVRVSAADFDPAGQPSATQRTVWTRVFETTPCQSPTQAGFAYLESGGRLALQEDGTLLLTVGDFGLGHDVKSAPSQSTESSYGKVLAIGADGRADVYSFGHRNAQGLLIDRDHRVWLTEHGAQGGDEINLLRRGGNYGYPLVTYGTDYGRTVWLAAPEQRNHGQYIEPVQAFVPSIAISNLIQIRSAAWREWNGDLLIGSLQSQRLYRARLRDDRIVYLEPIFVGVRIRDLAEAADGRIGIWNDAGRLVTLMPGPTTPIGSVVFARCQTCHDSPGADAIAPSLRGIVDAPVARDTRFVYSPALAKAGGRWTEDRLDAFLENPAAFAPGTIMTAGATPDDQERRVLIAFLKAYR